MAKDNETRMPSGQGGLVQYYEADSGFEIGPKTVIGMSVGVAVVTVSLHTGIFF